MVSLLSGRNFETRQYEGEIAERSFDFSKDIEVEDLIVARGDIHHIFPREYLKKNDLRRGLREMENKACI